MLRAEDQFHLGIVTADLAATRELLSAGLGYQWGPESGGPTEVNLAGGEVLVADLQCVFSLSEPRLELVRSIPGTLWEPVAVGGIHHVAYWSDDVAADSAALEGAGYVAEAKSLTRGGNPIFAYYRAPHGYRVEVVSRAMEPGISRCWATGPVSG